MRWYDVRWYDVRWYDVRWCDVSSYNVSSYDVSSYNAITRSPRAMIAITPYTGEKNVKRLKIGTSKRYKVPVPKRRYWIPQRSPILWRGRRHDLWRGRRHGGDHEVWGYRGGRKSRQSR